METDVTVPPTELQAGESHKGEEVGQAPRVTQPYESDPTQRKWKDWRWPQEVHTKDPRWPPPVLFLLLLVLR